MQERLIELKANELLKLLATGVVEALTDFTVFEGDEAAGIDCGGADA